MAHFAEVADGVVQRVVAVSNDVTTIDGVEDEQRGIDFLHELLPESDTWVQTSVNNNIRHQYAGAGYIYDAADDVFYPPRPFPSWSLDSGYEWQPPVARADKGYVWDEDSVSWVQPPSPYPSWEWWEDPEEDVAYWIAPGEYPDPAEGPWVWDEAEQEWIHP